MLGTELRKTVSIQLGFSLLEHTPDTSFSTLPLSNSDVSHSPHALHTSLNKVLFSSSYLLAWVYSKVWVYLKFHRFQSLHALDDWASAFNIWSDIKRMDLSHFVSYARTMRRIKTHGLVFSSFHLMQLDLKLTRILNSFWIGTLNLANAKVTFDHRLELFHIS